MTNRERIIAALHHREVDRLPFSPLVDDYFVAGLKEQGFSFNLMQSLDYIGCDVMLRHVRSYDTVLGGGIEKIDRTEGNRSITEIRTPVGNLTCSTVFSKGTFFIEEHMIKSVDDIKTATYLAENTDYKPCYEDFYEVERRLGDKGIATAEGILSPIMDVIQFGVGLMNTAYFMADYEGEMKELLAVMHERNKRAFRLMRALKCEAVIAYEDTSSTLLNEDWLLSYEKPAVKDYADILHEGDKVYITHMCGKLNAFKNHIAGFASDGIDSLCPPTTGDLCLWDAQRALPDKVLIGGIEPPALTRMNKEETLRYVIDFINNMPAKRGVILSTGDATPNGTPIDNLKAIVRLLDKLGERSLSCGLSYHDVAGI